MRGGAAGTRAGRRASDKVELVVPPVFLAVGDGEDCLLGRIEGSRRHYEGETAAERPAAQADGLIPDVNVVNMVAAEVPQAGCGLSLLSVRVAPSLVVLRTCASSRRRPLESEVVFDYGISPSAR